MKMAGVTITKAENLIVRVELQDGQVGWGEAPSAPTMTGDTLGSLVAAVRDHLAPLLIGKDATADHRPMLQRALVGNTGAHSAVEMALLDAACRATNSRLIDVALAKPARTAVRPMWLLGNATVEEDIAEAQAKLREGFNFFKLKIGVKPLRDEIAAAHAIRAALPGATLCADANCGLTLAAAKRYAERTRDAGLAFIEQPLPAGDLAGLKALTRASKTPIGMDESIHSLADIEAMKRAGAKGISLKLIKLGGFREAIRGGQAVQEARPQDQRRGQDRRVRASAPRRPCILPAQCPTSPGASASPTCTSPRTSCAARSRSRTARSPCPMDRDWALR